MRRAGSAGFSLLEVLVALAAMSLSLAALYQAVAGVVRSVDESGRRAHAVVLAESLLAVHETVPRGGVDERGSSRSGAATFAWRLAAAPVERDAARPEDWPLYRTEVWVRWRAGRAERTLHLVTLKLEQPVPIEEPQ